MNVPEVEAYIERKILFTGTRVKNLMAAGQNGRPATFSGWPAIYFFRNSWPAIYFFKKWPAGSRGWLAILQYISLALFYSSRESSKYFHATGESKAFIPDTFRCPDCQKYALLWLSFVYRVVVFAYRVVRRADVFCVFESLLSV